MVDGPAPAGTVGWGWPQLVCVVPLQVLPSMTETVSSSAFVT